MSTYYYTPNISLEEISKKIAVGDNVENLPYLNYYYFVELIRKQHKHVDFLYEGMNFIVFSF